MPSLVQIDLFYRTGASAVATSIVAFAVATGAIASIVLTLTESVAAAALAAATFALNPNVLYLQSTPMTEPLLIALTTLSVAMLIGWPRAALKSCATAVTKSSRAKAVDSGSAGLQACRTSSIGWAFALACLTRYEAWPVTVVALAGAAWARWRHGEALTIALRQVASIAAYPAIAIVAFAIFSRVVIGEWFVASGFFTPENKALHDPLMAAAEIWWGTSMLSGSLLAALGAIGVAGLLAIGVADRRRPEALIATALVATAAVPWAAFIDGHPFRIRYMVPLIAAEAVGAGIVAGFMARTRLVVGMAMLAVIAYELRPLDRSAPMVVEAQWDRPNVPARASVTACLGRPHDGEKIMASMGSLGHYMQEASRAGFAIGDFLHEGNGDIWLAALEGPLPYADWILIEEKAEGGDMLAKRAREKPTFLAGYTRACEGAGLALYRRRGEAAPRAHRAP